MDRRRRNQLCLGIAVLGLANYAAYTILYGYIGGDAFNGEIIDGVFYVRGHFLRNRDGMETPVSRGVWIYSYLHSISIWPTHAAVLLAMLVLARPHILATLRDGWISGETLVTVMATGILLTASTVTIWFTLDFIRQLGRVGP